MLQAAARITTVSKKPDGFFTEWCLSCRVLTVKLSGRPMGSDQRRGRTLSFRARGAQPPTFHGPLQRLLDRSISHSNPSNAEPSGDAAMDMRGLPASDSHRM